MSPLYMYIPHTYFSASFCLSSLTPHLSYSEFSDPSILGLHTKCVFSHWKYARYSSFILSLRCS